MNNDWIRATACVGAMALLLAWPPSLAYVLAALLLLQAKFYFTRALAALESPDDDPPVPVRRGDAAPARRPRV